MMDLLGLTQADVWVYQMVVVNLVIAVAMITGLRFISGLVAKVHSGDELAKRDNFAFGISMSGGLFALALMLTGALAGEAGATFWAELFAVLGYGLLGLLLIIFGRFIQDYLVLPGLPVQGEIRAGNMAAAVVDLANSLALGLILRAVMLWVESNALVDLLAVLLGFLASQLLMALVTHYRLFVYSRRHPGGSLQAALRRGNLALAFRYLGHLLGAALAVTAASGMVAYDPDRFALSLGVWMLVSLALVMLVSLLAVVARRVILLDVNTVEEVDRQRNVGVALVEGTIFLTMGLLLAALLA